MGRVSLRSFFSLFRRRSDDSETRALYSFVYRQTGHKPVAINLYQQAMTHRSCFQPLEGPRSTHINERLEYLGDAVLDLCVGELLFKAYPDAEEGLLTSMRSKIVNTQHLSELARQMSLPELLRYKGDAPSSNVIGSALEAFIGAVYLDQGYAKARYFVQRRLLARYVSLEQLRGQIFNYKGRIVEWAQKQKKELQFDTVHVKGASVQKKFRATLLLGKEELSYAQAPNKKEAQRQAAKIACRVLNLS